MSRVRILNFHGIGQPHAGVPDDELPYWVNADVFARIVERIAGSPARGRIRITFDDGNASDLEIAAPALRRAGLTAQFFVLTGRLGARHYLDAGGLHALQQMGMTLGLHGRDHLDWRRLDAAGFERETAAARDELTAACGRPIDAVAIPFGAYDSKVIRRLRRQGFQAIYTSDGGAATADARVQARTSIRRDMDDAQIDRLLHGSDPLGRQVRRRASTFLRRHVV